MMLRQDLELHKSVRDLIRFTNIQPLLSMMDRKISRKKERDLIERMFLIDDESAFHEYKRLPNDKMTKILHRIKELDVEESPILNTYPYYPEYLSLLLMTNILKRTEIKQLSETISKGCDEVELEDIITWLKTKKKNTTRAKLLFFFTLISSGIDLTVRASTFRHETVELLTEEGISPEDLMTEYNKLKKNLIVNLLRLDL